MEELLELLQETMYLMSGVAIDPRVPQGARDSLNNQANKIEAKIEALSEM